MKKILNRIFIEGLSGMAQGLFATLIIGTILCQIAQLVGGVPGNYINMVGTMAKAITGAGIGVGVAAKFQETPLVTVSAAVTGMIGAFASQLLAGGVITGGMVSFKVPGEPLGAFVAAYLAIEAGHLVSGKTKMDIILTPLVSIGVGAAVGILAGPPISRFMTLIGSLIEWGMAQQPLIMGVVVAVLMGMTLTLPISSAAIGISLGLTGLSAGAATIGCCCQMVGFAVASYKENKIGGLISQGIGTSMLQMPNIMRRPLIWIPPILSSAILGPVSSCILKMQSNAIGSGMGTSGLVGPIMTYQVMSAYQSPVWVVIQICIMYFVLPGALTLAIADAMIKLGWIKGKDMVLDA